MHYLWSSSFNLYNPSKPGLLAFSFYKGEEQKLREANLLL